MPQRVLKASLLYFASVFGVGVVLGTLRVLWLVPRLGVRVAELLEQPLMLLASYLLAGFVLRRLGPFSPGQRIAIGALALAWLVGAELALTLFVQGRSLAEYVASRDAVSGTVYLLALLAFAAMPLLAGRPRRD